MLVRKRDNTVEKFNFGKIEKAIESAFDSCKKHIEATKKGNFDDIKKNAVIDILNCLKEKYKEENDITVDVEDIQDNVEYCLMSSDFQEVAKSYIIYRYLHKLVRENQSKLTKDIRKKLLAEDVQNQNANVDEYSFGGRMGEASRLVTKKYALDLCMSRKARRNHENNEIYIHDLDSYAVGMTNCLTSPLDDLLNNGFNTRQTDVRPANSLNTAFQLVAVIFQLQSLQQFGGVSGSHLDWTMVKFFRKSFMKHYINAYIKQSDSFYDVDIAKVSSELYKDEKGLERTSIDKLINDYKDKFFKETGLSEEDFRLDNKDKLDAKLYQSALFDTINELNQAVEGMYHNLNTLQSRSGNQLPFTSINYGTCTLPEGRLVIQALLQGSIKGVGKFHKTAIFPCSIFQCMKGVNRKEGDPNYDLYKLALKSTSLRIYPNYVNVDWTVNEGYDKNDPRTYTSTMGCHAKDTPIVMADGTRKMVQDVKVGDKLMGVNGQTRVVESLIRGNDKLFKVNQSRAESYVVNEGHVLSLKYTASREYKGYKKGDIVNIRLHDFLEIPESSRRFFKGYKSAYELGEKDFKIPPYILGLWLGDGLKNGAKFSVNKNEEKIIKDLEEYAISIGRKLKIDEDGEKCYAVTISDKDKQHELNPFRQALKDLNLVDNKHIPEEYFFGSTKQRSELLAGLINTDGWARNGRGRKSVCFGNTNLSLIEGAKKIANSLGYNTNIIKARGECIGTGICEGSKLKPYYHLNIHSFDDELLMEHKRSVNSTSIRNFDTSTISIEEFGVGDFYGFELDGDRLYLIDDGTVTHNCRTYNGKDINADEGQNPQIKDGRGNLAPVTVIMPTLAMEVKESLKDTEYTKDDITKAFMKLLDKKISESKDMLLERFEWMCKQSPASAKFMWENNTMLGYKEEEGIRSALRHGTLAIGQLGLAETLQILIGTNHVSEEGMALAKEIEGLFNKRAAEYKNKYKLNFGVYYTPAENLCYTAMKKFKDKYGDVENVTYINLPEKDEHGNIMYDENRKVKFKRHDKCYFTNSIHVPVWEEMTPFEKIDIEAQLVNYSNAGCITYVELPASTKNNIEALETIVDYAMDNDIPYFAINVPIDTCEDCGYSGEIGDVCPSCGSTHISHLRRVTGYLTGDYKSAFNPGKQEESDDRVKHIKKF